MVLKPPSIYSDLPWLNSQEPSMIVESHVRSVDAQRKRRKPRALGEKKRHTNQKPSKKHQKRTLQYMYIILIINSTIKFIINIDRYGSFTRIDIHQNSMYIHVVDC